MASALICETEAWKALMAHVEDVKKTHLRELMSDTKRCQSLTAYNTCFIFMFGSLKIKNGTLCRMLLNFVLFLRDISEFDGVLLDYSRQCATVDTLNKLHKLAEAAHLKEKINRMFNGERINSTENRSFLHVALRAPRDSVINSDGKNVVPDVWQVLDKIKDFSDRVRSGAWVGATGKVLENVIAIGIGGSFLGPLFVHTALQTDPEAAELANGRKLHFCCCIKNFHHS